MSKGYISDSRAMNRRISDSSVAMCAHHWKRRVNDRAPTCVSYSFIYNELNGPQVQKKSYGTLSSVVGQVLASMWRPRAIAMRIRYSTPNPRNVLLCTVWTTTLNCKVYLFCHGTSCCPLLSLCHSKYCTVLQCLYMVQCSITVRYSIQAMNRIL